MRVKWVLEVHGNCPYQVCDCFIINVRGVSDQEIDYFGNSLGNFGNCLLFVQVCMLQSRGNSGT